jgi:DNA-binding IclR family transcriptional regulator
MARAAPAATRAASIVSFLTAHSSRGFTITELAQHLGMNIASAHATLAVLCDFGFLVRHPVHRTYMLGPALAVTGFAALEQHPAVQAAMEQAEILVRELGAEIGVYAIAGRDVIFLARRGPEPLASTSGYPGDRSPLLAPFGAVFMAWADEDAVAAWLERAGVTDTVADLYRRVLTEVRTLGFSVPLRTIASPAIGKAMARLSMDPTDDAEHELTDVLQQTDEPILLFEDMSPSDEVTFRTVAAPIFDPIGRVLLSISITGPEHPVPVEQVLRLGQRLQQSAGIATRQARGRIPERGAIPRPSPR